MADQAGTVAGSIAGTETQIGTTVTTEGGAELVVRIEGSSIAGTEVVRFYYKEKVNNQVASKGNEIAVQGVNAPSVVRLGPVSVPGSNAGLSFYLIQDSGTMRTFSYEIREF